jgi:hypothetical protein
MGRSGDGSVEGYACLGPIGTYIVSVAFGRGGGWAGRIPFAATKLFDRRTVISLGQVLGRGNVTKLFIDYLRIAADQKIKDFPKNVLGAGNTGALLDAMRGNVGFISILLLEAVASLANICFVFIAVGFLLFALARPQKVSSKIGSVAFQCMLIIASILFGVIASSEIVDAAQARLRNPVEAGLIILCSLFFFYRLRAGEDGEPVTIPRLRSGTNLDA